jgi:L-rhamnose mutarotase
MNVMRYCLALDLKDDEQLIAAYDEYHQSVWPEIIDSIKSSGIKSLEIYRVSNRLFMIMETDVDFSFENKAALDALPFAKPGEKWVLMQKIFST